MNIYSKDWVDGHGKTIEKTGLNNSGQPYSGINGQDPEILLVERIKNEIITLINANKLAATDLSIFLPERLHAEYDYLSSLFSNVTETSITRFITDYKIERVKELIVHEGLDLIEICKLLNYKSVAQMSRELKKVTGLTVAHFKKIRQKRAISLQAAQ